MPAKKPAKKTTRSSKSPDLQSAFKHEKNTTKELLILAAIAVVSCFLPWTHFYYPGVVSANASGMSSWGFLTFFGGILYLANWALPKMKIEIPKIDNIKKILPIVILAGPVLYIISGHTGFGQASYGFWIALAASALMTYFTFTGKSLRIIK